MLGFSDLACGRWTGQLESGLSRSPWESLAHTASHHKALRLSWPPLKPERPARAGGSTQSQRREQAWAQGSACQCCSQAELSLQFPSFSHGKHTSVADRHQERRKKAGGGTCLCANMRPPRETCRMLTTPRCKAALRLLPRLAETPLTGTGAGLLGPSRWTILTSWWS